MAANRFSAFMRYVVWALIALVPAAPSPAQSIEPADEWRVDTTAWIWVLGVEGDVGARGVTADVSADFRDIIDASDSVFGLSGRLGIGKGRWGGYIDGLYSKLGAEDQSGPMGVPDVDVTFEMTLIEFGLTYRIGEWTPGGDAARNRHNMTLDLYAGGRYTSLEIEVDPAEAESSSGSREWLDPIVGAKFVLPLSQHWQLSANGDVGGFGVESDFTWSATAVVGYDFHLFKIPATFYAGYRAIGQDFTDGSGDDEFVWDVVQHGPIIGIGFTF